MNFSIKTSRERPFQGNSVEKVASDLIHFLIRRSWVACICRVFALVARSKRRFG